MANPNNSVDIAAGIEISFKLHPHRIGRRHQVIEDSVGHLFMGDRTVAVAVDIELDRLELHHPRTGLIDQAQHREIGITRERALAGEFGQLNRDLIRPPGSWVLEGNQLSVSNGTLAVLGRLGLLVGN